MRMKGSRRRRRARQREGERNRDGKRETEAEKKKVTHSYDGNEKWMETEIIPALPTETRKAAQQAGHCGKRRNLGDRGGTLHK